MHNLVENGLVVSEKNKFDFSYVNNPGPMSRNDLDLELCLTLNYLISCLHLQMFR